MSTKNEQLNRPFECSGYLNRGPGEAFVFRVIPNILTKGTDLLSLLLQTIVLHRLPRTQVKSSFQTSIRVPPRTRLKGDRATLRKNKTLAVSNLDQIRAGSRYVIIRLRLLFQSFFQRYPYVPHRLQDQSLIQQVCVRTFDPVLRPQ